MREVIRGHQRSSEVIRGHQRSSALQTDGVTVDTFDEGRYG
jgi:hypothetical protein